MQTSKTPPASPKSLVGPPHNDRNNSKHRGFKNTSPATAAAAVYKTDNTYIIYCASSYYYNTSSRLRSTWTTAVSYVRVLFYAMRFQYTDTDFFF